MKEFSFLSLSITIYYFLIGGKQLSSFLFMTRTLSEIHKELYIDKIQHYEYCHLFQTHWMQNTLVKQQQKCPGTQDTEHLCNFFSEFWHRFDFWLFSYRFQVIWFRIHTWWVRHYAILGFKFPSCQDSHLCFQSYQEPELTGLQQAGG